MTDHSIATTREEGVVLIQLYTAFVGQIADGGQLSGAQRRILALEVDDELARVRRQGAAVAAIRRVEVVGLAADGALGGPGLARPRGRRLAEQHNGANQLERAVLRPLSPQRELLVVVGRLTAWACVARHDPSLLDAPLSASLYATGRWNANRVEWHLVLWAPEYACRRKQRGSSIQGRLFP
jgi:hypothetical protein